MCVVRVRACMHRVCCICAYVCKQLYKYACVLCVCVYRALRVLYVVCTRACMCPFPQSFLNALDRMPVRPLADSLSGNTLPCGEFHTRQESQDQEQHGNGPEDKQLR